MMKSSHFQGCLNDKKRDLVNFITSPRHLIKHESPPGRGKGVQISGQVCFLPTPFSDYWDVTLTRQSISFSTSLRPSHRASLLKKRNLRSTDHRLRNMTLIKQELFQHQNQNLVFLGIRKSGL